MVNVFFEDTEILDLDPEFFVSWLSEVCRNHGKSMGEISLIFCSDNYLLNMDRTYLNHDYYTDIITFDYTNAEEVNGDLFISADRVRENAATMGEPLKKELYRVVVHGVLHLIGFKDTSEEEKREMREQEDWALTKIVSRGT